VSARLSARDLGIPERETHARDIMFRDATGRAEAILYRTPPHRSRWRRMRHQGDDCVWIRVRIPKAKAPRNA